MVIISTNVKRWGKQINFDIQDIGISSPTLSILIDCKKIPATVLINQRY
jgi:hypothetical protein